MFNKRLIYVLLPILLLFGTSAMANVANAAVTCSTKSFLTLYSTSAPNTTVGIDNVSLRALLNAFVYSNATQSCELVGYANQSVSFYIPNGNSPLIDLGTSRTNMFGNASISYNSSLVGVGSYGAFARYYGNSSAPSVQSNNVTITLIRPTAGINASCVGAGCGNTTIGLKFTILAKLCVGKQPFLWSKCTPVANQRLIFNQSTYNIGTAVTNATGIAAFTYNTSLLGVGQYDVFAKWAGSKQYAFANTSSINTGTQIDVLPSKTTASTSTSASTTAYVTTSTSGGNQSSGGAPTSAPSAANSLIIGGIVVVIIIVAVALLMMRRKPPHNRHSRMRPSYKPEVQTTNRPPQQ